MNWQVFFDLTGD